MGAVELKELINQYVTDADEKVLRIVKAVFESYQVEETPEVFRKLIEKGLEDSEAGRVRSHKDVMSDIRKRYNVAG